MTAKGRILELVRLHLEGDHHADVVRFINELLAATAEFGETRCSLADKGTLRFESAAGPSFEVCLSRAKSKLRMLCARLGVLCTESGTLEGTLYGGKGTIADQWQISFMNTPGEQSFTIGLGANKAERPWKQPLGTAMSQSDVTNSAPLKQANG